MIAETVMRKMITENRKAAQEPFTECVIYDSEPLVHATGVLTTTELLTRLEAKGVKNADIARALKVAPSRVTEIKKGERTIKLDEAAKLVFEFDLESPPVPKVSPLPPAVSRLIVRYIAEELECPVGEDRLQEIAEDVRAFAEFVADPTTRGSIEAAELFFQAMRLRRPKPD